MKPVLMSNSLFWAIVFFVVQPAFVFADSSEIRCGWYLNPKDDRAVLHDKDGDWLIANIGEYEAKGNWTPSLNRDDKTVFVRTDGLHGYGCVCMHAQVDRTRKKVLAVDHIDAKKLADCIGDKNLKDSQFAKTALKQIKKTKSIKTNENDEMSELDRAHLSKETQEKVSIEATKAFAKAYKKKFTEHGNLNIRDFSCRKSGTGFDCETFWAPIECAEGSNKGGHASPRNSFHFEMKPGGAITVDSLYWETYEDVCL